MQEPTAIDDRVHVRDLTVAEFRALIAPFTQALAPTAPKRDYYTLAEACEKLRCGDRHGRRLIAQGRLKAKKITTGRGSSRLLIPAESIEALLSGGE